MQCKRCIPGDFHSAISSTGNWMIYCKKGFRETAFYCIEQAVVRQQAKGTHIFLSHFCVLPILHFKGHISLSFHFRAPIHKNYPTSKINQFLLYFSWTELQQLLQLCIPAVLWHIITSKRVFHSAGSLNNAREYLWKRMVSPCITDRAVRMYYLRTVRHLNT